MTSLKQWLRPRQAAQLIKRTLGGSLGAAVPILGDAMASRDVRARYDFGAGPETLSADLFTDAEFDLDEDIVTAYEQWSQDRGLNGSRDYYGLEISAEDLRYWLKLNHPVPADKPAAERAARPTMETAARNFIMVTYPNEIPAGKTDKVLAREYTESTSARMSARTMRRARTHR